MAKFVQMIVTSMVGCAFDHGRRDAPYGKSICNNGCSVLVNRIWPRCLKGKAKIGWWRKEIAPSTALRKWFAHDPARWLEFKCHYFAELDELDGLRKLRAR